MRRGRHNHAAHLWPKGRRKKENCGKSYFDEAVDLSLSLVLTPSSPLFVLAYTSCYCTV
jgi:hypothetical protein